MCKESVPICDILQICKYDAYEGGGGGRSKNVPAIMLNFFNDIRYQTKRLLYMSRSRAKF